MLSLLTLFFLLLTRAEFKVGHVFIIKHMKGKTVVHKNKRILKYKYTIHGNKYLGSAIKTTTVQTIFFESWPMTNASDIKHPQTNYKASST